MAVTFMRRTKIPTSGNKYYTVQSKGGYSNCSYTATQAWTGSALYNCVSYAWGRCIEACCTSGYCSDLGKSATAMFNARIRGNPADIVGKAPSWATWKSAGTTPKIGDMIIWSGGSGTYGGCGHTGVIEKVYSNGKVDFSDCSSGYYSSRAGAGKGYFAYHTNVSLSSCMGSKYTYKGLIRPNVTFR